MMAAALLVVKATLILVVALAKRVDAVLRDDRPRTQLRTRTVAAAALAALLVTAAIKPRRPAAAQLDGAARPLTKEVAWSRNADAHLRILAALAKGIGETAGLLQPVNSAVRPVAAARLAGQVRITPH
jgi:hypothetical protein